MWSLVKILSGKIARKSGNNKAKKKTFKPQLDLLEARVTPSTTRTPIVFEIEAFVDKQVNGQAVYDPASSSYITEDLKDASRIYSKDFWVNYLTYRGEKNVNETLEKIYLLIYSPQKDSEKSVASWTNSLELKEGSQRLQGLIKGIDSKLNQTIYDNILVGEHAVKNENGKNVIRWIPGQLGGFMENPYNYDSRIVGKKINILEIVEKESKHNSALKTNKNGSNNGQKIPVFLISNGVKSEGGSYPFGYVSEIAPSKLNFNGPITLSLSNIIYGLVTSKENSKNKVVSNDQLSGQIANILVHEFGHLLGVSHPETDSKKPKWQDITSFNIMSHNRNRLKSLFLNSENGVFVVTTGDKTSKYVLPIQNAGTEVNFSRFESFEYIEGGHGKKEFFDEGFEVPELLLGEEPGFDKTEWKISEINTSINGLENQIRNKIQSSIVSSLSFKNPLLEKSISEALSSIPFEVNLPFPDSGFGSLSELRSWLAKNSSNFVFDENNPRTLFQAVSGATFTFSFDNSKFALDQNYLTSLGLDQASTNRLSGLLTGIGVEGNGGLSFEFQFGFDSKGAYFVPTGDIVATLGLSDSKNAFADPGVPGLEIDPELNGNFLLSASLGEFGERQYALPTTISFQVEGDISAGVRGVFKVGNGWAELPFDYEYRMNFDGSSFTVDPESGFDLQGFQDAFLDNVNEVFGLVGQGALDVFNKLKLPGEMTRILGDLSNIPLSLAESGSALFDSANFLNNPLSVTEFLANPQSMLKTNFSLDQNLKYSQQIANIEFAIGGNSILKAKQTFTGSVDVQADLSVKAQFQLDFENGNIDIVPGSVFTMNINPSASLSTSFKPIPGILEGVGSAGIGFFHNGQKGLVASTKFNGSTWESSVDGDFQITTDLKAKVLNEVEVIFQAVIPGKELGDGEFDLGDIVVTSNTDDLKQQLISKIEERKNDLYRNLIRKMADTKAVPEAVKRFLKEFVDVYENTIPFPGLSINDLNVSTINKYLPPNSRIVITGSQVGSINDLNQFADNQYGESDEKFFKFKIPIIDSTPNVIAQFLVGQTDIDLITAELNPKFEIYSQEFAVTPDIPIFTIGIADISAGVRMAPKVSIESYMKFGIDSQGLYLNRDSKPLSVSANLKFEAALSGNVLIAVQFVSAKMNLEFDLKQYGLALQSDKERIRSFGDINNRIIFEGKLDGNLTGDIWFGLGTRAVSPGQPIIGIGVETSVLKTNLVSKILTTEFQNPMGPIREEFARIKKDIASKAECASAGAALGSGFGPLGTAIGAIAGAGICEADLFPSLEQVFKNVEGFFKNPVGTTVEEINRWREQGGKIWNDSKKPWNDFVNWATSNGGALGDFARWADQRANVAADYATSKTKPLERLATGNTKWFEPKDSGEIGKETDFRVNISDEEILIDLSGAKGEVNIGIKDGEVVVFGRSDFKSRQIIGEYRIQRTRWWGEQYTERDTGRGENGYVYDSVLNSNTFKTSIGARRINIIGGIDVGAVSLSHSSGQIPMVFYKGTSGPDVVYSEVSGSFDLGEGKNVFVSIDSKGLNCQITTGGDSDSISFGPGSFSWKDFGGENTLSTEKADSTSSFLLNFGSNGFYKVFGGQGIEEIYANGAKVYGKLGGGNDKAFDLGNSSEVWLGDGDDKATVSGSNVQVFGEAGDDNLEGSSFSDYLNGGDGNNNLWGYDGDDVLISMIGGSTLVGGKGNDFLSSKEGASRFIGPDISKVNLDRMLADISNGILPTDSISIYGIDQSPGNDFVLGNDQDNIFVLGFSQKGAGFTDRVKDFSAKIYFGEPGDDDQSAKMKADANLIESGSGRDFILGGNGRDIVQLKNGKKDGFLLGGDDYVVVRDGVPNLDLGSGDDLFVIRNAGGNKPTDKGIVFGNKGKDRFYVLTGDNEFQGGEDDDAFFVTPGNNVIDGGQGNDSLFHVGTQANDHWVLDKKVGTGVSGNPLDELSIGTQEGSNDLSSIESLYLDLGGGNDQLIVNWAPVNSKLVTYLGLGDDLGVVNFDQDSAYGIQIRGGTADIPFAGQDLLEVRMKTPGALTRDLGNGGQFGTVMGSYAEGEISYIEYVGMRATTPGMTLNKAFIQSLYHNVLQRDGGPSEVDSWVPTLASFGIVGVIKRVMQSEEFSQMTVRDWYQMYLGRPASLAEMRPWIDMLKSGKSLEQVLPEMIASPEYFNRNGGSMGNFVQAVYRDFLERAGSKGEIDSWLIPLSRKMARQDMVRQVMGSVEYRRLVVQRFYSLFLRRDEDVPSTLEFPQWVERNLPSERELTSWIYNGENLSRVRNGFAASMEFFWFGR